MDANNRQGCWTRNRSRSSITERAPFRPASAKSVAAERDAIGGGAIPWAHTEGNFTETPNPGTPRRRHTVALSIPPLSRMPGRFGLSDRSGLTGPSMCLWPQRTKWCPSESRRCRTRSAAQTREWMLRRSPQSTSCQAIRLGTEVAGSRSAPKIGRCRSQNRTKGLEHAALTPCQGADLRVCVELRGFEPLTPSMRTEYDVRSARCSGAFSQVRQRRPVPKAASEGGWQRSSAPIPLPKSDNSGRGCSQ